jgi:5'-3' exonuclease
MITAIIDSNYIFHKTFGIFSGFGAKSPGDVLSSEGDRNMFVRKVMTDLCYSLNQIPDLHRVIFCKDSRSWRKDYQITRSVYKESRVKTEGVDWGSFFKLLEELGEFLSENGYIYSTCGGAEGDDLIWAWSEHLKDSDDDIIVITGDKDMHQLVRASNSNWTCIWNSQSKNNKFTVPQNWRLEEEKEPTIFDVTPSSGSNDHKLKHLISSCTIEEIDTKEFVFKKILMGDRKDDVPGVFPHVNKGGKNSNIAEGKAQKIWNLYVQSPWSSLSMEELWDNDEFLTWLAGLSLRLINQTDNSENRAIFKQFYEENGKLVWLNHRALPEDMVLKLREHVSKLDAQSPARNPLIDKKTMIEKSPWSDDSNTPQAFDPFAFFN